MNERAPRAARCCLTVELSCRAAEATTTRHTRNDTTGASSVPPTAALRSRSRPAARRAARLLKRLVRRRQQRLGYVERRKVTLTTLVPAICRSHNRQLGQEPSQEVGIAERYRRRRRQHSPRRIRSGFRSMTSSSKEGQRQEPRLARYRRSQCPRSTRAWRAPRTQEQLRRSLSEGPARTMATSTSGMPPSRSTSAQPSGCSRLTVIQLRSHHSVGSWLGGIIWRGWANPARFGAPRRG